MADQLKWFDGITKYIAGLYGLTRLTDVNEFEAKARPVAKIYNSLIYTLFMLTTSYSWRNHTLTPHEAAEMERYVNDVLVPAIREARGEYIERRRSEEFTTTP